jgi:hypothetical protein
MSDTRLLRITSCKDVYHGSNDKGDFIVYEIGAVDADGNPVEVDLRSFDNLPLDGEPREFEVTPYHGKNGVSYTLRLPGQARATGSSPGARLGPKVDELRERVDGLEHRLTQLEERLQAGPTPRLETAAAPTDEEDIPF